MNMVKVMYLVMAQMRKTVYICSEGDVLDNGPERFKVLMGSDGNLLLLRLLLSTRNIKSLVVLGTYP